MPSNEILREQAADLAKELEVDVTTDGLNNSALIELVQSLRTRRKGDPPPDETTPEQKPRPNLPPVNGAGEELGGPPQAQTRPRQPYPFMVAEGCTVTCLRGKLPAFSKVSASDLSKDPEAGAKELRKLVKSKHVVAREP